MKISKLAAQKLIDEFTKAKVDVTYSGESIDGYPQFWFGDESYEIVPFESKEERFTKIFEPFSLVINDTFVSPQNFPFKADPKYSPYLNNLRDEVIKEIESNINLRFSKWEILDYLINLEFELKEINKNIVPKVEYRFTDKRPEGYIELPIRIEAIPDTIYENSNIIIKEISENILPEDLYLKFALSRYWELQIPIIERLLKIIEIRKAIIEKNDDYVKEIDSLKTQPTLLWSKSDTDLLELIIALYESGAIQNTTKDITQKEAIQVFSDFFGKEIKDQYKKLNAARSRKKEDPGFIIKIQKALEDYYEKLNKRL